MTTETRDFIRKLSGSNSEIAISTLAKYLGSGRDVDKILTKHMNNDLFYVGGLPKTFTGRASDDDIIEKNYFVIDVDIRKEHLEQQGTVLGQEELLESIDHIKDAIASDSLFSQWSFIVCSGNGAHVIYTGQPHAYTKVEYKRGVEHIYREFESIFSETIPYKIDHSCANISKLFRLPGSINHKKDYAKYGIKNVACEILYEQEVESELYNKISLYAKEQEGNDPFKKMEQTINTCIAKAGYTKIIPGSLMDQINKKSLVDLVLSYTGRTLAPDGKNFVGGNNDDYKGCFMGDKASNLLIIDGTTHIPNPNNLQAHTTYTFIRDVLCGGDTADAFKKAKELYPDLEDNADDCVDIGNPFDHFLTYGDVLENAKNERRGLDINTACKYGIKILDEYLGGILPSELVVIGAETGIGKSELAYIIGRENSKRGKRVMLFELEGDVSEIALRDLQGHINSKLQSPIRTMQYRFNFDKSIYPVEDTILGEMNPEMKKNLLIFNKLQIPKLSFLEQVIEKAKDDVDMIIIDHLHYIYLEKEEELRQIGEIMRTLKTITDIIKKPIILISHLRKKDNRMKERDPSVDDLYGSSNIGKEATTVLLLSRMRAVDTWSVGVELPAGELDKRYCGTKIIVAKSRIGLPKSSFGLLYDRDKKMYMDKYQQLIADESFATEEDRLINPASIEI